VFGEPELPVLRSECEREQWLSGEVTVNVVDRQGNGIDGAEVSFQCGPSFVYNYDENGSVTAMQSFADRCMMGATEYGIFESRFPQCKGSGLLTVRKQGYLSRTVPIGDTLPGVGQSAIVQLEKVYEFTVDVQKIFVQPPGGSGIVLDGDQVVACINDGQAKPLQSYEQAIIKLEKTDEGTMHASPITYFTPGNVSKISIAPGTYNVDIMLVRNERFNGEMTISKDSESRTIPDGIASEKTISYPEKDVLVPTAFTGGAQFTWEVTAQELESGDTVRFKVYDEGPPKTLEEVSQPLSHREKCSELNIGQAMPRIQ